MTRRLLRALPLAVATLPFAAVCAAVPAAAQLRPLEPLPATTFAAAAPTVRLTVGAGGFADQRASLAGTEGTLIEMGNLTGIWRSGRVAIEVGGTAMRFFEDRSSYDDPTAVVSEQGPQRRDAGDFRVTTAVRLTPDAWRPVGFVRFGTRLPTTDDTSGLDRDRTDFVATAGGQWADEGWSAAAEIGIGIHGTHHLRLEQSDVLIYSVTGARRFGQITADAIFLGHFDGMPGSIRGNEELSELRLGLSAGGRFWASAQWVMGFTPVSPSGGVLLTAGWRR